MQSRTPRPSRAVPRADRPRGSTPRHVGAIDGIRAIALVAVVLYHLGVSWLPSGHMGVIVFLVLGGYLVTSSILKRLRREGPVAIVGFWAGRLRRLWPPMAAMVLLVGATCVVVSHVLLTKMRPDLAPSLLLSTNVAAIARGASYFDEIGGPSPLTHLWYLGLDAQFCLVWPLVMLLVARTPRRARGLGVVASLVLALASAVAMAVLYDPAQDPTRVYYGPDTRLFAPLMGAALACWWPLGSRRPPLLGGRLDPSDAQLQLAGAVGLVGLLLVMLFSGPSSPFLYRGGMLLVSLLSCALLAGALVEDGVVGQLLSLPPAGWLGSRSYGIYLWHFPLIQLLGTQGSIDLVPQGLVVVALSCVLAELSYRLIEQQLSGGLAAFLARARDGVLGRNGARSPLAVAGCTACVAVTLTALIGAAVVPDEYLVPKEAITSTGESADHAQTLSGPEADAAAEDDEPTDLDNLPTGKIVLRESADQVRQGVYSPVMVGDSVPGDAQDEFAEYFPTGILDSYVGRRPDQMAVVLDDYLQQGVVGDVVILEAFSNNVALDSEVEAMIEACGERSIFLVLTHIPQSEGTQINAQLRRMAEKYANVELIDWYTLAEANPSYLYADATHLTPDGKEPYISLIANAIARTFAERGGRVLSRDDDASASELEQAVQEPRRAVMEAAEGALEAALGAALRGNAAGR